MAGAENYVQIDEENQQQDNYPDHRTLFEAISRLSFRQGVQSIFDNIYSGLVLVYGLYDFYQRRRGYRMVREDDLQRQQQQQEPQQQREQQQHQLGGHGQQGGGQRRRHRRRFWQRRQVQHQQQQLQQQQQRQNQNDIAVDIEANVGVEADLFLVNEAANFPVEAAPEAVPLSEVLTEF